MIGRTVSHYEILEQIGSGAMGVVYRARDQRLDRIVAIKMISGTLLADPAAQARFVQEARAASALDHPNICAIHEIDETPDGQTYLVMAYYPGATLDRRLEAGPLATAEAVGIAVQVADGLAQAHAHGIVHRDVKPSNVIVTEAGVVKILDFGLAKVAGGSALTQTGASLGTPAYMAPEQVTGGAVGPAADVWAIGVMLHAMLAGKPPFRGDHMAAVIYSVLNAEPERLRALRPEVSEALDAIVVRCLSKDAGARYPDAGALASDLRSVLRDLVPAGGGGSTAAAVPIVARAALTPARAPRSWGAIGRRLAPGVAAVAVAAVLAAIAWFVLARRSGEPLRIAVPPAEVTSGADSLTAALVAPEVQIALVRALSLLKGISVIDPAELQKDRSPLEAAREVSADDFVAASLQGSPEEWQVTMRRVSAGDGSVQWTESFAVPRDQSLVLANALATRVRSAYSKHAPRSGAVTAAIRPDDYDEYLRLHRGFLDRGAKAASLDEIEQRLDRLLARSPRFVDAHLLATDLATYRLHMTQDPRQAERAQSAGARARALAPDHPRPIEASFHAALERGRLDEARALLTRLREVAPGDVKVLPLESAVAEAEGRIDAAHASLLDAHRRRPSRTHLLRLADFEYRTGKIEAARDHLELMIERYPEDQFPRAKLAQLELLYGNAERAQAIFLDLSERYPETNSYRTNLGLARMLLGNYQGAVDILEVAHERNPTSTRILLNLADSEQLAGHRERAVATYARVLERLASSPAADRWDGALTAGQCLAQLGRAEEALSAARLGLARAPENSEALFMASLVYTLCAQPDSAAVLGIAALDRGVQPRWFGFPWFESLRRDPRMASRLARPVAAVATSPAR